MGRESQEAKSRREKKSERRWLEAGAELCEGQVKAVVVNWCEHRPVLGEASWFVIFTHQSIYFG